jgi:hypothetical protein
MAQVFLTSLTELGIAILDDFANDCDITRGEALEFLLLQGIQRVEDGFECDCDCECFNGDE